MRLDDEILALYYNSRRAYNGGAIESAERSYRRLRAEHGVELFYEVDLPDSLRFIHPIGTVLGRASYGNFLVVYQGVGVGSDVDGNRPVFGDGTVLFPGARVLGNVTLGNNVWVTANTVGHGVDIPDNSVVFMGPVDVRRRGAVSTELRARWKPTKRSVKKQFFGVE